MRYFRITRQLFSPYYRTLRPKGEKEKPTLMGRLYLIYLIQLSFR